MGRFAYIVFCCLRVHRWWALARRLPVFGCDAARSPPLSALGGNPCKHALGKSVPVRNAPCDIEPCSVHGSSIRTVCGETALCKRDGATRDGIITKPRAIFIAPRASSTLSPSFLSCVVGGMVGLSKVVYPAYMGGRSARRFGSDLVDSGLRAVHVNDSCR